MTMMNVEIHPVTAERWEDLEMLFSHGGSCSSCWCMWWRLANKEFAELRSAGNKNAMRTLVQQGSEPGLLAYVDGSLAGWVTVAPRAEYVRLKTSRQYAPVDDAPVWSIPCFVVHREFRKKGLTLVLINAAVDYAKAHGAMMIEAYPTDPQEEVNPSNIYRGILSTFIKAGFTEVACRKPGRPVMRKRLD